MAMESNLAGGYIDFARFYALRDTAAHDKQQALDGVAEEFEALFVDLMLKAARDAQIDSDLFGSQALSTYQEMFDQQIAKAIARDTDFGIGAAMAQQFGEQIDSPGRADAVTPLSATGLPLPIIATSEPARAASQRQQFVNRITPAARQAASRLGVEPRFVIAQAALETGWGEHALRTERGLSAHNYFGIKASSDWHGKTVNLPTTEYIGGRMQTVEASFRAYDSIAEGFDDYVNFLNENPRYQAALANAGDGENFVGALADAGYATDPAYAQKIISIVQRSDWTVPVQIGMSGVLE